MEVTIEDSWRAQLQGEFNKQYFIELTNFIKKEIKKEIIYPHPSLIFNAFNQCAFDDVKVVILGQDPYHGYGQAHGLSFSVPDDIKIPPSLRNIFKEINFDLGYRPNPSGNLLRWSRQGVLLINSILTVKKDHPASHKGIGWELFTDAVVDLISTKRENVVFFLWGAYAQKKGLIVERNKHLVIESSHPSPFSADRGFFGSNQFSKCNTYLSHYDKKPINWI
jgi:uracil-DNA glycosylase